ncbi:MAG: hypothetical protein ACLFVP_01135 [Candidatus Bathyarchaeia archaeon]
MYRKIGLFFILAVSLSIPTVMAENGLEMALRVDPEPVSSQITSGETYLFNISLTKSTSNPWGAGDSGEPGDIIVSLRINWWVKGSYRFGDSIRSYVHRLDEKEHNQTTSIPEYSEDVFITFNHTFSRDCFDFGVHPYETLEIQVEVASYVRDYNETLETFVKGEELGRTSRVVYLLDDDKMEYVEGRLQDLQVELSLLEALPASDTSLNEEDYLDILEDMREYMEVGDYISALKVYQRYDGKERERLVPELILDLNESLTSASRIPQLESRIGRLERNVENLQSQIIQLQEQYHQKQEQYERQKSLTTTAFTGIWIVGIISFLAGTLIHRLTGKG